MVVSIEEIQERLDSGDAKIVDKVCTGVVWPEGDHYLVIEDYIDQCVKHVII